MGKFNVKHDKNRFKAAAKSKKKEAGKGDGSTSKRKEPEVEQLQKPKQLKKVRIDVGPSEVEPSKKKLSFGSVVVGLRVGNATTGEQPGEMIPEQLRMKEFLGEVSKAFLKSSFDESTSSDSNRAKFQLSFNRVISGLYAQFEAVSSLDSIERPLKEKVVDLECRLKEAEADFDKANGALEKKKVSISKLQAVLIETENANQTLWIELEEARGRYELEVRQLRYQVLELQGLVARQCEKIKQLKVGEGLDLEAFIDSDAFTNIKDSIEDVTGDELVRRIKEVHPNLNLSFLTAAEPSASPILNVEQGAYEAKPKTVDPSTGDQGFASPCL